MTLLIVPKMPFDSLASVAALGVVMRFCVSFFCGSDEGPRRKNLPNISVCEKIRNLSLLTISIK